MSLEFRPIKEGRQIAGWVRALKNRSGCYLIREKNGFLFFNGDVVYIGESHTDRLYSTLLRHFQHWTGKTAGPTFAASKVEVAVVRCPANRALGLQNSLIEEYRPRLNTVANPDTEKG
jgi:excinuclease UvrABC nuclease subunit